MLWQILEVVGVIRAGEGSLFVNGNRKRLFSLSFTPFTHQTEEVEEEDEEEEEDFQQEEHEKSSTTARDRNVNAIVVAVHPNLAVAEETHGVEEGAGGDSDGSGGGWVVRAAWGGVEQESSKDDGEDEGFCEGREGGRGGEGVGGQFRSSIQNTSIQTRYRSVKRRTRLLHHLRQLYVANDHIRCFIRSVWLSGNARSRKYI